MNLLIGNKSNFKNELLNCIHFEMNTLLYYSIIQRIYKNPHLSLFSSLNWNKVLTTTSS